MKLRLFLLACLLLLHASFAFGAQTDPSASCDQAAAQAAREFDVPIDILLAISRVETGRGDGAPWPWTINADGIGTWYDDRQAAVDAATAHQSDGTGTFDVGCFQLNIRWHGEGFASLSDMFDPAQNADYAASFLLELYEELGDWSQAVAAYHSRTPDLAEDYLQKVKAVLEGPAPPSPPELVAEAEPRENRFPLLQAGGQGSAGSIVPLQTARGPLIGGTS
jgi:hypothetical protein